MLKEIVEKYQNIIEEKEKKYPGKFSTNDKAWVKGVITQPFECISSMKNGEKMYQTIIMAEKEDGKTNYVPINVPERLLPNGFENIPLYTSVEVAGTVRTCKKFNDDVKNLFIVAKMINIGNEENEESENAVFVEGFTVHEPTFKTLEEGRRSAFLTVEVSPKKGKRSFISCVAWNEVADHVISTINKGDRVRLYGCIRSKSTNESKERDVKKERYVVFLISIEKSSKK